MVLNNVFRRLVEKESHRIYRKRKEDVKDWRKNVLCNKDSDKVVHLEDKGNRFIIVDKETDHEKVNKQIERSSFLKIDCDLTILHIYKVKEWPTKWISRNEISKNWARYIVNKNAVTGEHSMLYERHKANNSVSLLTTECNTVIENLSRFIKWSVPLLLIILKQGLEIQLIYLILLMS